MITAVSLRSPGLGRSAPTGSGSQVPVKDLLAGHEDDTFVLSHVVEYLAEVFDAMTYPRHVGVNGMNVLQSVHRDGSEKDWGAGVP